MGKAKANMWAESVISSFSEKTNKVYDDIASGKQQKTSGKMQKFDQELYSEILKSLLSQDASPESEALQLFDKLSSHKLRYSAADSVDFGLSEWTERQLRCSLSTRGVNTPHRTQFARGRPFISTAIQTNAGTAGSSHAIYLGSRDPSRQDDERRRRREHLELAASISKLRAIRRAVAGRTER